MRTKHDSVCLWWKDWHSCSCGFLEEEARQQILLSTPTGNKLFPKKLSEELKTLVLKIDSKEQDLECQEMIPGTFIMCGEGVGEQKQYCSTYCYNKSKGE